MAVLAQHYLASSNAPAQLAARVDKATLVDAASIVTDASLSNSFEVTISQNSAFADPTNLLKGETYVWLVSQASPGGFTLGKAPIMRTPTGAINMPPGFPATVALTFHYDGTTLNLLSQADALS